VWLDIEGPDYWSKSHADNVAFIKGYVHVVLWTEEVV
jgi:hypothetical protein